MKEPAGSDRQSPFWTRIPIIGRLWAASAQGAKLSRSERAVLIALEAAGLVLLIGLTLLADRGIRASLRVDIGHSGDVGYLVRGFYGREQATGVVSAYGSEEADYRWTADQAHLQLTPLAARTTYVLKLRTLGLPLPDTGVPPNLILSLDGQKVLTAPLTPYLSEYTVIVPPAATSDGALHLGLQVDQPGTVESRVLGILVDQVTLLALEVGDSEPISLLFPPPPYTIALLLVYLAGCFAGFTPPGRLLLAGTLCLLALAGLFLWPTAAPHLGTLLAVGAGTGLAVVGARRLLGRLSPRPAAFPRWLLIVFLLGLLAMFVPWLGGDGLGYYAYLRSLALDGDLDFSNDLSPDVNPFQNPDTQALSWRTPTGYVLNAFSVGPALLWSPFFGLAHLISHLGRASGLAWSADGFASPYILLVTFASALASLWGLILIYAVGRKLFSREGALAGTLLAFLGTTWLYYTFLEGSFPHALSAFVVALFLFLWWKAEQAWNWRRGLLLGLSAGLMCLVYWIHALLLILLAPLAWDLLRLASQKCWPEARKQLSAWAAFAAGSLAAFLPQLIAWKILFGQFLVAPQGSSFIRPAGFWLGQLLFSTLHGLFLWTPATLLALFGLILLVRRFPRKGWIIIVAVGLYILYNATLESWHGKGAFGIRRLTSIAPFLALGLMALWEWGKRFRLPWVPLLGTLTGVWQFLVLLRYRFYLLPHDVFELDSLTIDEFILNPGNAPLLKVTPLLQDGLAWTQLRACVQPAGDIPCAISLFWLVLVILLSGASFLLLTRWLRLEQEERTAAPK
jgi:hypothetical protein